MFACDFIVERLVRLGIHHVFGVGGANIEDMFAAVQRRRPLIRAVLCKHEHAAGTAADAYARLRGLGVVMTTSGGGAMNLVHAMAEARASEVPVLAIVGEPPTAVQGQGAFQDTSGLGGTVDARAILQAAAGHCIRVERLGDLPDALDRALAATGGARPGPSVLLLAKDLQRAELARQDALQPSQASWAAPGPYPQDIQLARAWLDGGPVVIIAGAGVSRARSQEDLAQLATLLDATVATTPDARDAFDNRNPRFLGVSGAMGHPAVAQALKDAQVVVLAGSALPLLARQGLEPILVDSKILSLGRLHPFIRPAQGLHVDGELGQVLRALRAALADGQPRLAPRRALEPTFAAPQAALAPAHAQLGSAAILGAIDRVAPDGSVVLVDAGNTGASAVHYVRAPRGGRWLIAMGMAGMGYTFGAATGAALASGARCIVLAGDGAFFMHGMEIHTAIEHSLPITYILFNNRAHGMCLVRERLLLGENAGYNVFRRSHLGAGLAAMFPDLAACDCQTQAELERALARSLAVEGPSVICAELRDVEIPPFTAFQERAPSSATVTREVDDGRNDRPSAR